MFWKRKTLEEKLVDLEKCGFKLTEPYSVDDLLHEWGREAFEKRGYEMLLVGLGGESTPGKGMNPCENLLHFDAECIEDNGDYKKIAARMMEMSQGSLILENIKDCVDYENEKAWLSFEFRGEEIKINCKFEDDWVDPYIFDKFIELLKIADPSKLYLYYDLDGQDCLLACATLENYKKLRKLGIKFGPLR